MDPPAGIGHLKSEPKPILFLDCFEMPFGLHLGFSLETFWILFGIEISPSSVQDALPSGIFFKNVLFTKAL